MRSTASDRCPRNGGTRSILSTSGVRISAMMPAKMKRSSTLKTCTRMNAEPSQIQINARMIASQISARRERISRSGWVRVDAAARVGPGAGRLFTARPRRGAATRLDGDVLKIEPTQLAGPRNVMGVEKLQAANHLASAGQVHPIRAAQPGHGSQR